MKIKTITCHDVYNYGATLQAYALMHYLQNKGYDVEIIDYKPDYLSTRYNLWSLGPKWKSKNAFVKLLYYLLKVPKRLLLYRGKKPFDLFKNEYMRITRQRYKSNNELQKNPPLADAYIAGSDQIWNTLYENGRDPAFYLDFAPKGTKKISYAASFATPEILPEYKTFVKSMIEKFDSISVRETQGISILQSIGIERGSHVLDPVFLLGGEEWEQMVVGKKINKKYILVYDFENNPLIERIVKKIAKQNELMIYAVNNYGKTHYADKDYYNSGPETFLALVRDAEIVVSNSFHATAFSIIFEKEFFVFDRIKQEVNSRMRDLLKYCGIKDRLILSEDNLDTVGDRSIVYTKVNDKLNILISRSKSFLENVLQ